MGTYPADLSGRTFGDLAVVSHAGQLGADRSHQWLCRCVCGQETTVRASLLMRGRTKSCGCLRWRKMTRHGETAGYSATPEYGAWRSMKQRCDNPKSRSYANYGGRGIAVCERWSASFQAFLEDMGRRPTAAHSIDRYPDKDGDYEPSNCRWATRLQQQNNLRSNRPVTIGDRSFRSLKAAQRATGLSWSAVRNHLNKEEINAQ